MDYSEDYLLNRRIKIFQPQEGYRAAIDAVFLASMIDTKKVKTGMKILDVGSGTGAVSLCLAYRLKDKKPEIIGLEIQEEIAKILDKYEYLTKSIIKELPYEIELRKKQYDYYKNILLSFKEEKI